MSFIHDGNDWRAHCAICSEDLTGVHASTIEDANAAFCSERCCEKFCKKNRYGTKYTFKKEYDEFNSDCWAKRVK